MSELDAIETWAGALLSKLAPAGRRTVMRTIARELQRSQRERIARQRNPDDSAYEKRKPRSSRTLRGKAGRTKRAAMFVKIRQTRYLRARSDANGLEVGFAGRIARLARIHQYGQRVPVAHNGPEYQYPARALLGLSKNDCSIIRDLLIASLR